MEGERPWRVASPVSVITFFRLHTHTNTHTHARARENVVAEEEEIFTV